MKFAKQLQAEANPRFAGHYINYKLLKKLLNVLPGQSIGSVSRHFLSALQRDVVGVNAFVLEHQEALRTERVAIDALRDSGADEAVLLARERAVWHRAEELHDFAALNYTAVYKALKKHDKVLGLAQLGPGMALLDKQPFVDVAGLLHAAGDDSDKATELEVTVPPVTRGMAASSTTTGEKTRIRGARPLTAQQRAAIPILEAPARMAIRPARQIAPRSDYFSPPADPLATIVGGETDDDTWDEGASLSGESTLLEPAALRAAQLETDRRGSHVHRVESLDGQLRDAAGVDTAASLMPRPSTESQLHASHPSLSHVVSDGDLEAPEFARGGPIRVCHLPNAGSHYPLHSTQLQTIEEEAPRALDDVEPAVVIQVEESAGCVDASQMPPLVSTDNVTLTTASVAAMPPSVSATTAPITNDGSGVTPGDTVAIPLSAPFDDVSAVSLTTADQTTITKAALAVPKEGLDVVLSTRRVAEVVVVGDQDVPTSSTIAEPVPVVAAWNGSQLASPRPLNAHEHQLQSPIRLQGQLLASAEKEKRSAVPVRSPTKVTRPTVARDLASLSATGEKNYDTTSQRASVSTAVDAGTAVWLRYDVAAATEMMRQFERALRSAHAVAADALCFASPELANSRTERVKRLAPLSRALLEAHRMVSRVVRARRPLRRIHDAILAAKLSVYRATVDMLLREIELVFPEGAAALEAVQAGHFKLFEMYLSRHVRAPSRHRIDLVHRLLAAALKPSRHRGGTSSSFALPPTGDAGAPLSSDDASQKDDARTSRTASSKFDNDDSIDTTDRRRDNTSNIENGDDEDRRSMVDDNVGLDIDSPSSALATARSAMTHEGPPLTWRLQPTVASRRSSVVSGSGVAQSSSAHSTAPSPSRIAPRTGFSRDVTVETATALQNALPVGRKSGDVHRSLAVMHPAGRLHAGGTGFIQRYSSSHTVQQHSSALDSASSTSSSRDQSGRTSFAEVSERQAIPAQRGSFKAVRRAGQRRVSSTTNAALALHDSVRFLTTSRACAMPERRIRERSRRHRRAALPHAAVLPGVANERTRAMRRDSLSSPSSPSLSSQESSIIREARTRGRSQQPVTTADVEGGAHVAVLVDAQSAIDAYRAPDSSNIAPSTASCCRLVRWRVPRLTPLWQTRLLYALGLGNDDDSVPVSTIVGSTAEPSISNVSKRMWSRWRPAIFDWLPEYKVRKYMPRDVLAGVTIGVLLVPQGLAYAVLAGMPPIYGLYSAFPAVVYACLGTSRQGAVGPQSIPALLIASGLASMDPPPTSAADYVSCVATVSLYVGILCLVLGWLQLSFIVRFVSRPVLLGFTIASAVLTMLSSTSSLLGAPVAHGLTVMDYAVNIVAALPLTHWPTVITAAAALTLLVQMPKYATTRRIPPSLVVVVLSIGIFALASRVGTAGGIKLVGPVPSGLPVIAFPTLTGGSRLPSLLATACTVTFVGYVERLVDIMQRRC